MAAKVESLKGGAPNEGEEVAGVGLAVGVDQIAGGEGTGGPDLAGGTVRRETGRERGVDVRVLCYHLYDAHTY